MDDRSWLVLRPDPPQLALPDDLRQRDPLGGRDCGSVSQMQPFLRQYSRPGDLVLDPFCGFASTLVAAHLEGRRGIGCDIDAGRASLARERLQRLGIASDGVFTGSLATCDVADGSVDLCLTNIPYFGCDWNGTADDVQLYASASFARYLQGLREVFHRVRPLLREDGYCVVMVQNVTLGGRMVPQAWEVGRLLASLLTPCEERILCYPKPATTSAALDARTNRSHEYALVYRKSRQRLDPQAAEALLAALHDAGFPLQAFGSYPRWRADPSGHLPPQDLDLYLPDDPQRWPALLEWLKAHGFILSLWGEPLQQALTPELLQRHHYLRATRLLADGSTLQLDLCAAGTDDQRAADSSRASLRIDAPS